MNCANFAGVPAETKDGNGALTSSKSLQNCLFKTVLVSPREIWVETESECQRFSNKGCREYSQDMPNATFPCILYPVILLLPNSSRFQTRSRLPQPSHLYLPRPKLPYPRPFPYSLPSTRISIRISKFRSPKS